MARLCCYGHGNSGLPAGQAQEAFPAVTWAGTDAPTNWAGEPASVTLAENYTLLDNLQWVKGKHTFTFGGQIAWLLYNVINDTGGTFACHTRHSRHRDGGHHTLQ